VYSKVKIFPLLFLFFYGVYRCNSQSCIQIYDSSITLFKQSKYDIALKKLAAYKICDPNNARRADSIILRIYKAINAQKNEALTQRNLANRRAVTIEAQKDSIEKENTANMMATQALQIKEIDPTKAVQYVFDGLCFSPQNLPLTGIKKKILSSEILRTPLLGASSNNTTCISRFNPQLLVTGDAEGYLKFWNATNKTLVKSIKLLNNSISVLSVIAEKYVLVSGNDSKISKKPNYIIKLYNSTENRSTTLPFKLSSQYTSAAYLGDSSKVFLGNVQGLISCFSLSDTSLQPIRQDSLKIVGIQCWQNAKKIFYATPFGIYDIKNNKEIYQPRGEISITYFGFCQSTADMYIGIGEDLISYNYLTSKDQLLYPIHKGMISSCHCADSAGGFITTSLDNNAALWTANGNLKQVLKGNRSEIYDSYLSPDANYAITVGRRELNAGVNADTNTVKYWYLEGLISKVIKDAHFMGGTAIIHIDRSNLFVSSGVDGNIIVWDSSFIFRNSKKISSSGISKLKWDVNNKKLIYGTFSGEIGIIDISDSGLIKTVSSIQFHTTSAITGIEVIDNKIFSIAKDGMLHMQSNSNELLDSVYFDKELSSITLSDNKNDLLLSAGNKTIIYNLQNRSCKIFNHEVRVNSSLWLSKNRFVTISGQYLRIWDLNNQHAPLLKINNNIQNIMTSIFIDWANRVIYTGTWSGYIICWDFSGKQLYEFDQLTSLANTNIIQDITSNRDHSKLVTVDYNGNIGIFYSPFYFLRDELKISIDCNKVFKTPK
jgi:hypothetical protein